MLDPSTPDACTTMGKLEYVVESRHDGETERWYVVRPGREMAPRYQAMGIAWTPGCRVVVEALSLRPVGLLEPELPEVPPPFGCNPYFDPPPA